MATIKCPECGKTFNDTKQACPNCGCPANECSVVEHKEHENQNDETLEKTIGSRYTKGSLLHGETVVATAKWQVKPIKIVFIIIAILFWIYFALLFRNGLYLYNTYAVPFFSSPIIIVFSLALLFSFGSGIVSWMMRFREFTITNKRVIAYYGFIRRVAFELRIEKVESITVYQGLLARLFKCGMVQVRGVGASKASVHFVKDPFEFRQHFFDLQYAEKQNTLK